MLARADGITMTETAEPQAQKKRDISGRISERNQARQDDLERRRQDKVDTEAADESPDAFWSSFNADREALAADIAGLRSGGGDARPKEELEKEVTALSERVQALQKRASDATLFLASYDVRQTQDHVSKLTNALAECKAAVLPKKKFAFKSKRTAATKPAPTAATAAAASASASAPRPAAAAAAATKAPVDRFGFADKAGTRLEMGAEEMRGRDVSLSRLTNCTVVLTGTATAIHLDGLKSCVVAAGPVTGSLFIDDCVDCTFIIACHQLRTHNTLRSRFFLHVTSDPIIEDCEEVAFAPYHWEYDQAEEHFKEAGLDRSTNYWDKVNDFKWLRADMKSPHWRILGADERPSVSELLVERTT